MNGFSPLTLIFCTFVVTWFVFSLRNRRNRTGLQWLSVLFDACATGMIVMFVAIGVWAVAALDMNFIGGGTVGLVLAIGIMIGWVVFNLGGDKEKPHAHEGARREQAPTEPD